MPICGRMLRMSYSVIAAKYLTLVIVIALVWRIRHELSRSVITVQCEGVGLSHPARTFISQLAICLPCVEN